MVSRSTTPSLLERPESPVWDAKIQMTVPPWCQVLALSLPILHEIAYRAKQVWYNIFVP